MKPVKCSNGHFYDSDKYAECPHCNNVKSNSDANKTVLISEQPYKSHENEAPISQPDVHITKPEVSLTQKEAVTTPDVVMPLDEPITQPEIPQEILEEQNREIDVQPIQAEAIINPIIYEPVESEKVVQKEWNETLETLNNESVQDEQNVSISEEKELVQPQMHHEEIDIPSITEDPAQSEMGQEDQGPRIQFQTNFNEEVDSTLNLRSKIAPQHHYYEDDDDEKTILRPKIKYQEEPQQPIKRPKIVVDPLYSWLVAINGEDKGQIFKISKSQNIIGRNIEYEVPLMKDRTVSRKHCAYITYDEGSKVHRFKSTELGGLIYHNKRVLLEEVTLNEYDLLTVGETELLFVPLSNQ